MQAKKLTIAVTGAAGQIGYALLFRIASGEMFGQNTEIHLRLLELDTALSALNGVVMELEDCAFPLLKSIVQTSVLATAFQDADWAFLGGSVPRKAGMERGELLKINGKIFIEQGQALDCCAKKTCKILVVGNPCNTNAYIAKTVCKKIPQSNFFAMTMLDQNRAVNELSKKAKVDVKDVKNLVIWGNHSATQYPDADNALIKGRPVREWIQDTEWLQNDFLKAVQQRGAKIIEARGKSSAASAANGVVQTVQYLTTPSNPKEFFSVAVSSDGSYGVPAGLMFSFPVQSDGERWHIVQGLPLTDFAKEKIQITTNELLEEKTSFERG